MRCRVRRAARARGSRGRAGGAARAGRRRAPGRRDRLVHLQHHATAVVEIGAERAPGAGHVEARSAMPAPSSRRRNSSASAAMADASVVPKQAWSTGAAGKSSSAAWIIAAVAATGDRVGLRATPGPAAGASSPCRWRCGAARRRRRAAGPLVVGEAFGDEGAAARSASRSRAGRRHDPRADVLAEHGVGHADTAASCTSGCSRSTASTSVA